MRLVPHRRTRSSRQSVSCATLHDPAPPPLDISCSLPSTALPHCTAQDRILCQLCLVFELKIKLDSHQTAAINGSGVAAAAEACRRLQWLQGAKGRLLGQVKQRSVGSGEARRLERQAGLRLGV